MKTRILVLAILMGFTTVLMAQPGQKNDPKKGAGVEWRNRANSDQHGPMLTLNLSDAQKDAFKQSMLAMQKEIKPLRNELGEALAHQKTLVSADTPDLKAIDKNLDKIGDLKTEMAKIRAKYQLEMRAQLTPEQQMKFDLKKGRMNHPMGDRFRQHMPGMNMRSGSLN
jgi:Spy/CpxP family protein refolding chaperone